MEEFQKLVMAEFAKLREKPSSEVSSLLLDEVCFEFKMVVKKVELPPFDGDDPVRWVTRAETYFERSLIERYGGRKSDNSFEELKDLQQMGDVEEYILEFEYVSSQVGRLPEEQYLGYFMGGLKSEIRLRSFVEVWYAEAVTHVNGREKESHTGPGGVGENESGSIPSGGSGLGLQPKLDQYKNNPGSNYTIGGPTKTAQSNINSYPNSSRGMGRSGQNAETRSNLSKNREIRHLPYSELMDRKAKVFASGVANDIILYINAQRSNFAW
ncbi:hypothetical protein KIW84_046322 [Lathyrus oleraceus]|uniref:Retrotransposon gag domain-containing protein n=1 Tax=Pisum sativum TaxID=3888 RepID=A0A9D4XMP3_PEA|nr:hypothetical protein KIW84_046322 [Pisum sativum]